MIINRLKSDLNGILTKFFNIVVSPFLKAGHFLQRNRGGKKKGLVKCPPGPNRKYNRNTTILFGNLAIIVFS
jgi:hypothetical protein